MYMVKDEDGLYTYEFSDVEHQAGIPIPPQRSNNTGQRTDQDIKSVHFEKKDGGSKDLLSGISKDRSEKLKNLYKSVLELKREPMKAGFIELARKYENVKVDNAEHIPFSCYWPSYETMTQKQIEWFFFWRDKVRSSIYPDTDLSYVFLHIYELINQIGVKNSEDGFSQLCKLWSNYRDRYPSLDRYLVTWVQDYIHIYMKDNLYDLLNYIPDQNLLFLFPDYMVIENIYKSNCTMPLEFVSRFSDYDFLKSKFCINDNENRLLRYIPGVFGYINQYLLKKEGRGIFEIYKPQEEKIRNRLPFQNAIYHGNVKSIKVEPFLYVENRILRIFFTSVIKYLENRLRQLAGYKSRLRGFILREEMIDVIDRFVDEQIIKEKAEKSSIKIEIDREKIMKLIHDSNVIRQMLLDGIPENLQRNDTYIENDIKIDISKTEKEYSYIINSEAEDKNIYCPERREIYENNYLTLENINNTDKDSKLSPHEGINTIGVNDDLFDLVKSLDEESRNVVKFIINNNYESEDCVLANAFPDIFLQPVIDGINESAVLTIGDILFVCESGVWILCDDYRDDLSLIFKVL